METTVLGKDDEVIGTTEMTSYAPEILQPDETGLFYQNIRPDFNLDVGSPDAPQNIKISYEYETVDKNEKEGILNVKSTDYKEDGGLSKITAVIENPSDKQIDYVELLGAGYDKSGKLLHFFLPSDVIKEISPKGEANAEFLATYDFNSIPTDFADITTVTVKAYGKTFKED